MDNYFILQIIVQYCIFFCNSYCTIFGGSFRFSCPPALPPSFYFFEHFPYFLAP